MWPDFRRDQKLSRDVFMHCWIHLVDLYVWEWKLLIPNLWEKLVWNILFVLPSSDFDIDQYWPHLISWEWFPTLSFSWRDYVNWSSFLKYLLEFSGQPILDWRFLFQKFYVTVSISLKFIWVFRWCILFCFMYVVVMLFGVYIFRIIMDSCWIDSFSLM